MATERQNEKIELSTEDCRNATELYMDTKDNVAKAVLDRNDVANECIARHQADLGEKEYQKISKEGLKRWTSWICPRSKTERLLTGLMKI